MNDEMFFTEDEIDSGLPEYVDYGNYIDKACISRPIDPEYASASSYMNIKLNQKEILQVFYALMRVRDGFVEKGHEPPKHLATVLEKMFVICTGKPEPDYIDDIPF